MSGALIRAGRLKPEIRLAQAVSEFEADLSSEEKMRFQAQRSQSLSRAPDSSDVMRLTAEIDRSAPDKLGRRRCFGPRMTSFLQAVQQFAALGDIIIGGSQNLIACGVWSLVRITLLSVVQYSSYIEKLSTLLMTVGRSAPRYQQMAIIYPRSKTMQSSLSEYFIVVVRLCHCLLKFTRMSVLQQLAHGFSDSESKMYQSELERWAFAIKEDMDLLVAKKIEEEGEENSRFRALASRQSERDSLRRRMKTKLRALDLCSTYDHDTTWKQIRKAGNTTLFEQNAEYGDWKGMAESCTLVYTGKLGSGKSVLLANIVHDLYIHAGSQNIIVAHFFCRHDIAESLKARTIFGSLARQVLQRIPDLYMTAEIFDPTSAFLGNDQIAQLLQRALPATFKVYFVLDGLDECDSTERDILLEIFRDIQETSMLLLCISFRLEPDTSLKLRSDQIPAAKFTGIPDPNPDIEALIEAELERCISSRRLIVRDAAIITEIQDALTAGSQGMFLWVILQIASLCSMESDKAIRHALTDLPKDLSETFSRVLRRAEGSKGHYQRLILELLIAALRPLTTEELREALSVTPGDTEFDPASQLNEIRSMLGSCGGLVIVDEEEMTVRLVHHSVKQFLLDGFDDSAEGVFTMDKAKRRMADIVVTYLNYTVFESQLVTTATPQLSARALLPTIIGSTLGSSSNLRNLAVKLLESRTQPNHDIGKTLAKSGQLAKAPPQQEFHFRLYAKSFWLAHGVEVLEKESLTYNLFLRLIRKMASDMNLAEEEDRLLLPQLAADGHEKAVKLILETNEADLNIRDRSGRPLLSWAFDRNYETIVKLLLETGKVNTEIKDEAGRALLWHAVNEKSETVIKLLLASGTVDVNARDINHQTPLLVATFRGRNEVVKLLLDTGKVDMNTKDGYGHTPLSRAILNGYENIVKLLLETGKADVNAKNDHGNTPLTLAITNGERQIVKLLLETGKVDVNAKDGYGHTPLSLAAQNGYENIVKLLLETGKIDVDAKNQYDQTPLFLAVRTRREQIVKLLIKTDKADVNAKNKQGETPLIWAAINGSEQMVKLLLKTDKVDINAKDKRGKTPLSLAKIGKYWKIVELLQEAGNVDVESKDTEDRVVRY